MKLLSALLQEYDIFLVDAYGVFWDGSGLIPGSQELLASLVTAGKQVIILSNTTQRTQPAMEKYHHAGLRQGEHYRALVTSGEVARHILTDGLLFNDKQVSRYYNFGTPNPTLFQDLPYERVALQDADFIYIGVPQFSQAEQDILKGDYPFFASCAPKAGEEPRWDTTEIDAFSPMIAQLVKTGLPVFNANPDCVAPEKCKISGSVHSVIRQGSIANVLAEKKLLVRQCGKPYSDVYAFCRALLLTELGISIEELHRLKVAMVGDTLATDIAGAHNTSRQLNWPVDSILTLTGNATNGLAVSDYCQDGVLKAHLQQQFKQFSCHPTHIITAFSIEGTIFSDMV